MSPSRTRPPKTRHSGQVPQGTALPDGRYSGPPTYDPEQIDAILSWRTCRENFDLWWEALVRFVDLFGFFLRILWMSWWDRQIWSYIGEEDIDRAQSLRRHRHGKAITQKLLALGPTFIKVGQSLSSRVDLLRREYIEELSKLQDQVPPFDLATVRRTIEEELGASPETLFAEFDPQPIAAASLGQVHRMTLHDGRQGVIKVQRPHLLRTFEVDLTILKFVARLLQRNTDLGRGREWVYIVDEFGRTLFEEVDYIKEGRNADRFRQNFAGLSGIVIPEIYWKYTSRRVIAMSYCPGIKLNDLDALEEAGFSRRTLSIYLVRAYFQQLLLDGFFHADPHPGNLVVDSEGRIVMYDFGMVGAIPDDIRSKMIATFLNIVGKRTDAILKNLVDLNMITPGADLEEIRIIVDWALENYYDVPHDQLNFEQLADEMAEVMYYYPFKLPASFTFMFRALITLEGVATTLYPQIQFMGIAVDYAQDFLAQHDLFDRLFGPGKAENYTALIREGLAWLGLEARERAQNHPRVRLYYEEWKPLGRYVKAGFLLLAFGQTMMLVMLMTVVFVIARHFIPHQVVLVTFFMVMMLLFHCMMTFGTLLWLPARKKPVLFNPPKRLPPQDGVPAPRGR